MLAGGGFWYKTLGEDGWHQSGVSLADISFLNSEFSVTPRKLTWQWNHNHLKMYLPLKIVIFRCHVSFFGGKHLNLKRPRTHKMTQGCCNAVDSPIWIRGSGSCYSSAWKFTISSRTLQGRCHFVDAPKKTRKWTVYGEIMFWARGCCVLKYPCFSKFNLLKMFLKHSPNLYVSQRPLCLNSTRHPPSLHLGVLPP